MKIIDFRILLLFLFLIPAGCIPHLANRVPNTKIVMSRLVAMPTVTASAEVDAYDNRAVDDLKADALFASINPEVQQQVRTRGALPLPIDRLNTCGKPCLGLFWGLMRWGAIASMEIAGQMKGGKNYGAKSITFWNLERDYSQLRAAIGADYALFVVVRDLRETSGRAALNFFGGVHTYFKQVGVACVADLVKRKMIWCHAQSDAWGDLTKAEEARRAVRELFSDLSP